MSKINERICSSKKRQTVTPHLEQTKNKPDEFLHTKRGIFNLFFNWTILDLTVRLFVFYFYRNLPRNFYQSLYSNPGPLVLEATNLSTMSQLSKAYPRGEFSKPFRRFKLNFKRDSDEPQILAQKQTTNLL